MSKDKLVFLKNSPATAHVRVRKFIDRFVARDICVECWCWQRNSCEASLLPCENFIFFGGGYGNRRLVILYFFWMFTLFIKVLASKDKFYFCCDFDTALPVYMAKQFKKNICYVYDVHDEFSIRYRMPSFLRSIISRIDVSVKHGSSFLIHVDPCRVRPSDKESIIVYNSPNDFLENFSVSKLPNHRSNNSTYGLAGLVSKGRGAESLIDFLNEFSNAKLQIAGKVLDKAGEKLVSHPRAEYLGELPQDQALRAMAGTVGLFSLYDPTLEINQLAASNKLYDAMMLGLPIIVNAGCLQANYVKENSIGLLVNFRFDNSWAHLLELTQASVREYLGSNGRQIYISHFRPETNIDPVVDRIKDEFF